MCSTYRGKKIEVSCTILYQYIYMYINDFITEESLLFYISESYVMACVIYITMYCRPHDRACLPWVCLHMDDMDLVTWPSKRQLRWFWRQVCGRYFERWEFMTLLCIQQKSGSSCHDIFMYITKPSILPVNILMLVTEVCNQYFCVNTQRMFYTLPVILIFVCRLRYVLLKIKPIGTYAVQHMTTLLCI
jgi:hypothetical protein